MAADVPTFRLLKLPKRALNNALRYFDGIKMVFFSLLSSETKRLVKSLGITIGTLGINPQGNVVVIVKNYGDTDTVWEFVRPKNTQEIYIPNQVMVRLEIPNSGNIEMEFENPNNYPMNNGKKSIWQWLQHFQHIFNHPIIDYIRFDDNECIYRMQFVRDMVSGLNLYSIVLANHCRIEFARTAVKCLPEVESIHIQGDQFYDLRELKDIFMRKLTLFSIMPEREIRLDHMILMNSLTITIHENSGISDRTLNRFLLLWKEGSNPRMKELILIHFVEEELDDNVILRGLNSELAGNDRKRTFRVYDYNGISVELEVEGGFVIRKNDGTEGTIVWKVLDESKYFIFYISP